MVAIAGILTLVLIASGCTAGQSPVSNLVKNVSVKTYEKDLDQWVGVQTTLNTGGFQMTSITLPIVDPTQNSKVYGQLSTAMALCSTCGTGNMVTVGVDLNLTQASLSHTTDALLPNGTNLPVGGLNNANVIGLTLASNEITNSKVYLAFGPGVAMLGTALAFSALDPAAHYAPGINIFQPFMADKIGMTAGIFTSKAGQVNGTGIGFFVDLSSVINNATQSSGLAQFQMGKTRVSFKKISTGSQQAQMQFGSKLMQMSNSKTQLKLQ